MFDRVLGSLRARLSVAVILAILALSGYLLARAATDYAARSLQRLASEQVAGAQLVGAAEPAPGARSSISRDSCPGFAGAAFSPSWVCRTAIC
jgi:hypothetical protein